MLGLAAKDVEVVKEFNSTESILEYFKLNTETAELAVMVDTFRPLMVTEEAMGIDDGQYYKSWVE